MPETASPHLTAPALCEGYADRVHRFATIVGPPGEVDDIAQDALEHAIRAVRMFDPGRGTVEAWLWRIVVRVAIDAQRRQQRQRALWERLSHHGKVEEVGDPQDTAVRDLAHRELLRRVGELGPRDRLVLGLRYGADLEITDVAAAMGIRRGAAAAAIRRAPVHLRSNLEASE